MTGLRDLFAGNLPTYCISLGADLLCTLGLALNPYGLKLICYPLDLALRQKLNIANVEEWQPLTVQSFRGLLFFAVLGGLFLLQLRANNRSWSLRSLLCVSIAVYAALRHTRFLFLAAILIAPIVAEQGSCLSTARREEDAVPTQKFAAAFSILVLLLLGSQQWRLSQRSVVAPKYPEQAVRYLGKVQLGHGRLFNEYLWGGYLEFYLPRLPVFIDSRVDIYERNGTFADYLNIIRLHNSLALLDKDQVNYVFFEPDTPLVELLRASRNWKIDYQDSVSILLERKSLLAYSSMNLSQSVSPATQK